MIIQNINTKMKNANHPQSNFPKRNSQSFIGGSIVLEKKLIESESKINGKISNKISEISEKVTDGFNGALRKLKGKNNELPVAKKPVLARIKGENLSEAAGEVFGQTLMDIVPGVNQIYHTIAANKAIEKHDDAKALNHAVGLIETTAKQTTAVAIAALTGPLAPVTYIAAIAGWNFVRKNIVKGLFK